MVASSPNLEEHLSLEDALARLRSQDQQKYRGVAKKTLADLGVNAKSLDALGAWKDGAENSLAHVIQDDIPEDKLNYLGAWLGLLANQKSVLTFRSDDGGPDSLHHVILPEPNARKIHQSLLDLGVPFHTIVPGPRQSQVYVYDSNHELTDRVGAFAQTHQGQVSTTLGRGTFVGDPEGTSRPRARREYRGIIRTYEAKGGDPAGAPQASGPQHAPSPTGVVERGLAYQQGQFLPKPY